MSRFYGRKLPRDEIAESIITIIIDGFMRNEPGKLESALDNIVRAAYLCADKFLAAGEGAREKAFGPQQDAADYLCNVVVGAAGKSLGEVAKAVHEPVGEDAPVVKQEPAADASTAADALIAAKIREALRTVCEEEAATRKRYLTSEHRVLATTAFDFDIRVSGLECLRFALEKALTIPVRSVR